MKTYGLWIDGQDVTAQSGETQDVLNPYNNEVVSTISMAGAEDLEIALASAHHAFETIMRKMPAHERAEILKRSAVILLEQAEEMAQIMCLEAGKPINACRGEVTRVAQFLEMAGEGAKRIKGDVIPMDAFPGGENRFGFTIRVPLGVVAAIGPFNAPLNLVVQKVAPAIAAGNSVLLKPTTKTPVTSLKLATIMKEAGLPDGVLNVITGAGRVIGDALVSDERVKMVTFTGGTEAGKRIHEKAGLKKTVLELGSNAPNIVFSDADLPVAIKSLAAGGFAAAGQACIAAQRLFIHEDIYDEFVKGLKQAVEKMTIGDPLDEKTQVGPMITEGDIERVMGWIDNATNKGAHLVTGGTREGNTLLPTILEDVDMSMEVFCDELFAPVCTVSKFKTKEEVVDLANQSRFGLQAGVFTKDWETALYLGEHIEVGGIWINDTSRTRQDNYPFGGFKDSGLGREGLDYSIEDMTELKFIGFKKSQ